MSIQLTFSMVSAEAFVSGEQHTWPLRVTAVSSEEGLPNEIFVWHSNAADVIDDAINPFKGDRCECVASVHQLSSITNTDTPDEPSGELRAPFYRADTALFHCLTLAQADALKAKIEADVRDLLENFRASKNLETGEVVEVTSPLTILVE